MNHLVSAFGGVVDRIKINTLRRDHRQGRHFWVKRRNWAARPLVACANHFFRLAGNPIRALDEPHLWQRWEVDCFLRLNGENFHAYAEGRDAVVAEEVPGRCLSSHLRAGTLTTAMLAAAACELRRAHAAECAELGGAWSHGDPHTGNFIYESATDRARLIDFEVMHDPALPADLRHADDLLIFLQDLAGRVAEDAWLPFALCFLAAYARPEIIALLREKLVVPGGPARLWWAVRTTWLGTADLRRRITALQAHLAAREGSLRA